MGRKAGVQWGTARGFPLRICSRTEGNFKMKKLQVVFVIRRLNKAMTLRSSQSTISASTGKGEGGVKTGGGTPDSD